MTDLATEVERISDDELEYHNSVILRYKWAQEIKTEIVKAEAAAVAWSEHLHTKYTISSADSIDEAGTITRASSHPDTL